MRRESFGIGTFAHIIQRGARQINIVRDDADRWRFLRLLRYLNDENVPRNWDRDITSEHVQNEFERPSHWGAQKPYVSLLAYCLMDNHFHLLVQEQVDNGIPLFMQRFCTSMATHFNAKYQERGALFQGPYKARVVDDDTHLQYLAAYIQVKNPFERHPNGLAYALRHFDAAFDWAKQDPFSSLGSYVGTRHSPLLNHDVIEEILSRDDFSTFVYDVLEGKYPENMNTEGLEID